MLRRLTAFSPLVSRYSRTTAAFQRARPIAAFHLSARRDAVAPFLLADIGEGITECEVTQWFVKAGDTVAQFDKICEVQSDKASVEITSRFDGKIVKLHYTVGQMAKVGAPIVDIDTPDGDAAPSTTAPAAPAPANVVTGSQGTTSALNVSGEHAQAGDNAHVLTTPAVRRIAREYNVDLSQIKGSGKQGRILKEDVLHFVEAGPSAQRSLSPQQTQPPKTASAPSAPTPAAKPMAADEVRPLNAIQKAMFKTMTKSLAIPHFGYADEIVLNNATQLRKEINRMLGKSHKEMGYSFSKISYMPIFLKTFSMALREFPILNACLLDGEDANKARLQMRASHNIGVAMDTSNGLIVPNIKNVQDKSILEIAAELTRLQDVAKRNSLSNADLQGGTISLSNIGAIGGTYMSPVVVSSELCIAAIGQTQRLPRFEKVKDEVTGEETEQITAQEIVNVSFSADHRVVDGATVARFAQRWKQYLQNPSAALANMR
ncbi:hypothetical protein RI367_001527 [Sorochytrium milnesiophthora]